MTRQPPDLPPEFDLAAELVRTQSALVLYVRTLVPNRVDADEVIQAANLTVWKNRGRFRPGTDFRGWVLRVAHYQVLTHRKRAARNRLQFDDTLFEALAARAATAARTADTRLDLLSGCVLRLPTADRELLRLRYAAGVGVRDIAIRQDRSVASVYRDLDRVHLTLLTEVRQALTAAEEVAP